MRRYGMLDGRLQATLCCDGKTTLFQKDRHFDRASLSVAGPVGRANPRLLVASNTTCRLGVEKLGQNGGVMTTSGTPNRDGDIARKGGFDYRGPTTDFPRSHMLICTCDRV